MSGFDYEINNRVRLTSVEQSEQNNTPLVEGEAHPGSPSDDPAEAAAGGKVEGYFGFIVYAKSMTNSKQAFLQKRKPQKSKIPGVGTAATNSNAQRDNIVGERII